MDISVIFGTFNRYENLLDCLGHVRIACRGLEYEIIIADGGSTDGTLEYLREQPDVRLIEHGRLLGPVKAYNDAFALAQGEYVAYLNDDLVLDRRALKAAMLMLKNDSIGVVSLPYTSSHDPKSVVWTVASKPDGETEAGRMASFGVLRRADGKRAGWFGPWFYHYHGDSNLCLSIQEAGKIVMALDFVACHHLRRDNAVRGFAWPITGAKERSQHDGFILRALWGGYQPGREVQKGIDRNLALELRDYYKLPHFIETGTYRGETAAWASENFEAAWSIENDERRWQKVVAQHGGIGNLTLIRGDSRTALKNLLNNRPHPALLWLDAHCRDWTKQGWQGADQNPLKDELRAVRPRDVVMIDDLWWIQGRPPFDYDPAQWPTLAEVEALLPGHDVLIRHGWNLLVSLPKEAKPLWEM